MIQAYIEFWRNFADFTGTATRSEYWYVSLVHFLMGLFAGFFGFIGLLKALITDQMPSAGVLIVTIVIIVYSVAAIIPLLSLTIRRLRDAGFHWAMIFIQYVPFIGGIVLLVLTCMPSKSSYY